MRKASVIPVGAFCFLFLTGSANKNAQIKGGTGKAINPAASGNLKLDADYGKLPLYFIANQGQMDKQVAYYVQGKDKTIYFTPGGITFALTKPSPEDHLPAIPGMVTSSQDLLQDKIEVREAGFNEQKAGPGHAMEGGPERGRRAASERCVVKLEFVGSDKSVKPIGEAETGAVVSSFKGKPEEWQTGLPTYSKIVYPNLWPGIDLVYYGTVNRLKYEFVVHPGADPSRIRLAYQGASAVEVKTEGRLEVKTPAGTFNDDVPIAYQNVDGRKGEVSVAYRLEPSGEAENSINRAEKEPGTNVHVYGFSVGAYDRSQTLVLDPALLIYCGYIGGSGPDVGWGIAVDGAGNAYITGYTISTEATFPVTGGPDATFNGGNYDAFIAKLNPSGTALIYCGYIGGSGSDWGYGIAVDSAGNAYVTGSTSSTEATFPVTVGPDLTYNGGNLDAFVTKVNAAGTALVYCGYIGGDSSEGGSGIAVDSSGNVCISGITGSTEATFPVTGGPDVTYNGGTNDVFVAKVNSSGTALVYCGYIGGDSSDYSVSILSIGQIAVDSAGNVYISGTTSSTEATFPVTGGPDVNLNGGEDAFVAKVNSAGTGLAYCGYIGGSGNDGGWGIAVDSAGNVYISGTTGSTEATFPVTEGQDVTYNGGDLDAFVAKVNSSGTALVYCGYIGGSNSDSSRGIAVDSAGNAYVTGYTLSTEATFPVTGGPDVTHNGGTTDAFVAKVNSSGTALVYCGYIGGSNSDYSCGITVDSAGNAYVIGGTASTEASFPVIVGPDMTYNGPQDAFVAKISYWDVWAAKHAVGDFDGDGSKEVAVDFGANGIYLYDNGSWTQISSLNPESLLAADVDGDTVDEILADLGQAGLWLWNAGAWNQLSGVNVEGMAVGDVDADGAAEVVGDFGAVGLWLYNGGAWTQLSGVNADYVTVANVDGAGGDEIFGDFGAAGLWVWNTGTWSILSGLNADYVMTGLQTGARFVLGDFGPTGLWLWSMPGLCTQLSGLNADYMIAANTDGDTEDEIIGDFGGTGLWHCEGGPWTGPGFTWTILSGVNADFMIRADIDGNGTDEVAADFGTLGLWLWNAGSWSQISGVNPEYHLAADLDGDNKDEILTDFGALGLWLWNEGSWSQISANNPD